MNENWLDTSKDEILGAIKDLADKQDDMLEAMNSFATHVDAEIGSLKSDVGSLKADVGSLKADVRELKIDVNELKSDMSYVKGVINTKMVTKDYLDDKMFKQSGELGGHLHKEDDKVNAVVEVLTAKKVINKAEAKKIVQMGPSFMKI